MWNIECLVMVSGQSVVTKVYDVRKLEGRPKLFFIEAGRGEVTQQPDQCNVMITKSVFVPL